MISLTLYGDFMNLRFRDRFKNKPTRIEKKKKIDVDFYL
jgi:hypothetical protein